MSDRDRFDIPDEVLIDKESGLALNIPIVFQVEPQWWVENPGAYAKLKMARERAGIVVEDFPNGPELPPEGQVHITMEERMVLLQKEIDGEDS